jgi:chromate reductase, NAD(P)H dehydrogenase (quinone)
VLKNAIDNASRPYGQSAWAGKPAGVMGVSVGAIGTAMSQQHPRNVLAYLDVPTLGQPEVFLQAKDGLFDENGNIGADSTTQLSATSKPGGLKKPGRIAWFYGSFNLR